MSSLQTAAMGLVIVFLDVGSGGWDWVLDPVGWGLVLMGLVPVKEHLPAYAGVAGLAWVCLAVSVLTLPPDSVDTIAPTLGWLFSLPTIAFCFLLCDSLADVTDESVAVWFRWLRVAFVLVAILPGLVYLAGFEWLTVPAAVGAVLTNITLVLLVWAAGSEDDEETSDALEKLRERQKLKAAGKTTRATERKPRPERKKESAEAPQDQPRKEDGGFDAEAVKRRVRREREAWEKQQSKDD